MRALIVLVSMFLAGCGASFAPPIRSVHGGAPGRLGANDLDIGGGATFVTAKGSPGAATGGLYLAYAVKEGVQLEAGTDHSLAVWSLGYMGARFTPWRQRQGAVRGALDLETGAGLGAGGKRCVPRESDGQCVGDGLSWTARLAGGGYLGMGIGMHAGSFALFARARGQATSALGVPLTIWGSGVAGAEVSLAPTVRFWASGGMGGYWNRLDAQRAPILELGLSFTLGSAERPAPPPGGN
jgi:hypothetical protein